MRRLGGWLFACSWLGCATSVQPAPRHAPLVCDPDAAEHVAFGVQNAGAWFAPTGQRFYGSHFLAIDGSCRWFAAHGDVDPRAQAGAVRTGTLDAETLAALNAELLTGPWAALDARFRAWGGPDAGSDAATFSLWREELGASCYSGCPGWDELVPLRESAREWERRLAERGEPFDGPVRLVAQSEPGPLPDARVWTGTTDLAAELAASSEPVVTDASDAATLRAWRDETEPRLALQLRVGDRLYFAYVIDAIPLADERGELRPPASLR